MARDENHIPIFRSWSGWYIAVLIIHLVGIIIYFIVTNTFTP